MMTAFRMTPPPMKVWAIAFLHLLTSGNPVALSPQPRQGQEAKEPSPSLVVRRLTTGKLHVLPMFKLNVYYPYELPTGKSIFCVCIAYVLSLIPFCFNSFPISANEGRGFKAKEGVSRQNSTDPSTAQRRKQV